ncbi:MAG: tetratricopeptide repeat protein [Proteobacteria bacterium]|nr:tetratricopeptide repeat protein [Pseudomonadota bacterium]
MRHDYLGNPVTGGGDATLAGIDDFIGGFLGYEERVLAILPAADAEPGHCLANAYAGWVWMFLESPDGPARAATYLARAEAAARGATRREQLTTALLRAWSDGDVVAATRRAGEILAEAPRDLAALKLHQYLDFNRGRCPEMLRVALASLPAAADVPQLHGMLAFAFEQCHLLRDAEAAARHALALLPREPWAQHALAHVMLTEGRIEEGIGFLESASATWNGLTSFMYTHNWWHLAVFYLSEGRFDEALGLYDRHVWARDREYSQDQVGAVSLLARLELAGQGVGNRWQELAGYLRARRADTVEPFLSLQYLYGLARAGCAEADELAAAIGARARSAPEPLRAAWAEVAWPAARGLLAHARADYATARRELGPTLARMLEIGGSHAQRDLFQQLYLDSLIRSGATIAAQQLLEERRRYEPRGVALNRALAGLYAELGLPDQAAAAAARARRP